MASLAVAAKTLNYLETKDQERTEEERRKKEKEEERRKMEDEN